MKFTTLAILSIAAASSSAFGLNGGAKNLVRTATRSVGAFQKPTTLVQPIDIQGNRLPSVVSFLVVVGVYLVLLLFRFVVDIYDTLS